MSNPENVGFEKFYDQWSDQLSEVVEELRSASQESNTQELSHRQTQLINKLMNHYGEYYRATAAATDRDVLYVYTAPWLSGFGRFLRWVAGWRPTTVINLVYKESIGSTVLLEHGINAFLREFRAGSLSDLSEDQLSAVSKLQCEIVEEEKSISRELSEWQDIAPSLIGPINGSHDAIGRLKIIIQKADNLRLRTMNGMIEILTPQQSMGFAIAAVGLQFGVRDFGSDEDR